MENAKFWTNKKKNLVPESESSQLTKEPSGMKMQTKNKRNKKDKKDKKLLKGLGVTGVILIVVTFIIGGLAYNYVVRPAYALMSTANVLKKDGNDITESLRNRDLVSLEKALSQTEKDLEKVRQERENSFGWAKDLEAFQINEFYSDSERFINAGFFGIDALREISEIVTPFADAAGLKISEDQELVETEGLMDAFQSWVSLMPEVADQMDGVIVTVSKIGKELEPVNVEKYPEEIRGFRLRDNVEFIKNTLANAGDYAPDIKQALTIFPRILGVDTTEKRYMIIMQNDKELRPTGGFMTNYSTFKVKDGLLNSDFTSKDMYSIDDTLDIIDAYYDFPDPPAAYMKFLKVERWYARDMNASPDFRTSMDQLLVFYNKAGQINPFEIKPVDGIIAIDTAVVAELLEVTGPVTVNGITYTNENVVLELEKIASLELREQVNRKKVLGDLMEEMLNNVFKSDKNLWSKLIDKAVDLSVRKHIQAYIFDEEAQALVEKYGFGGKVETEVEGDYASVISTNLGGDKTNWFVGKVVDHEIERSGEEWVRTIKVNYSYVEPDGEYAPFVKGFKDWVRVYVPAGSTVLSIEGSDDESEAKTEQDTELNKTYMTAFVEMAPGEEQELIFKYTLPAEVVQGENYMLTIQKQAGIDRELHTVTVNGKKTEIDLFKDTDFSTRL